MSDTQSFSALIQDRGQRWWKQKELPEISRLSGKLEGQNYVRQKGYAVPEILGVYDTIHKIPEFASLPDKFILKPSRGFSAKNVFVMDNGRNLLDDQHYDRNELIASIEANYAGAMPKFLIEEFLTNWDNRPGLPLDYKFYTFGSDIAFIHVIERNSAKNLSANRHWFLKPDWTNLNIRIQKSQRPEQDPIPRPDCLEELISTIQLLGASLGLFMRIDYYATTRGPVFGEFTPTPHGGNGYTPEADEWLGSLWQNREGV